MGAETALAGACQTIAARQSIRDLLAQAVLTDEAARTALGSRDSEADDAAKDADSALQMAVIASTGLTRAELHILGRFL